MIDFIEYPFSCYNCIFRGNCIICKRLNRARVHISIGKLKKQIFVITIQEFIKFLTIPKLKANHDWDNYLMDNVARIIGIPIIPIRTISYVHGSNIMVYFSKREIA